MLIYVKIIIEEVYRKEDNTNLKKYCPLFLQGLDTTLKAQAGASGIYYNNYLLKNIMFNPDTQ